VDQEPAVVPPQPQRPREPSSQPIPGYRLLEPLGKGGFGEVWKCEAPGGLFKAVKFVPCPDEQNSPANQEREALQLVKAIRHPFILSLERVEIVEGTLVIIMELADKSLLSLFEDYQARSLPGIPREELLGYLLEAAEALDWMNFGHGLQHLDIKPHNLFLVSNHVKVADFGLVDRLTDVDKTHPKARQGGITPLYAAPELLRGTVSRHCDQYSLAIVYQQLLTGTVPLWCQNMYQLMMLHLAGEPNLTPLPKDDRPIVARALSKQPNERFPSCLDFLQALICCGTAGRTHLPRRAATVRKILSSLQQPSEPLPEAPRSDDLEEEPSTDSLRPTPAASPTVPTSQDDKEEKTPAAGSSATVPRVELRGERPPAKRETQGVAGPRTALLPTCISLPGYRFLDCISQTPLGDVWKVEDEQGRLRRALCLHSFVEQKPALIERLQSLNHPVLPSAELAWSPSGHLVLTTEEFEKTLHDRLEICQKQGLPGIPREELLRYLRPVAEAVDALYQKHNLPHLSLNPRMLMLRDERVWLLDYGLVPLVWLPTGQTASSLNPRYAAPELFEKSDLSGVPPGEATLAALMGRAGSTADQFSLALIYAEMLNGIAPPLPRTPAPRRHGNGPPRRGRSDSGFIPLRGQARLDFDLLPTCDHALLIKAVHDDPQQRFPTCTALVEALETAISTAARRATLYHRLPPVIPFPSLQGEPPAKDIVLPSCRDLILKLAKPNQPAATRPHTIGGPQNTRYVLLDNGVWETKCPVQLFSGALALKVEGFRADWRARVVQRRDEGYLFHLDFQPPSRPGEREKSNPFTFAFDLQVQSAPGSAKYFAEARMRVFPSSGDRDRAAVILTELAPRLFDSMRSYLHAAPEQRAADRWPCPQALHVYPVRPDLELDEILEGICRNISLIGISFRVPQAPRVEQAYLHWHRSATVSSYALLARITRVQAMVGGGFEVGAVFPQPT
jgi:serine/threonine protein kinase